MDALKSSHQVIMAGLFPAEPQALIYAEKMKESADQWYRQI
jgi:hypothetical protein